MIGFGGPFEHSSVGGVGVRGTFVILQNGFVNTINNSVGIGVGVDIPFHGSGATVPIVLQWNFWMATQLSVFGEGGTAIGSGSGSSPFHPDFALGMRVHFTDRVALTLRAGYPAVSVGASFFF